MNEDNKKNLVFAAACIAGSIFTLCVLVAAGYRG